MWRTNVMQSESDVLIAVFWRWFGTPVNGAGSGTQSEIERAIESWKSRGAPEIMLFFRKPGLVTHLKSR
jgi:hypothetical protein